MAVSLGYNNVYSYPQGFPEWQARGLPSDITTDFNKVLDSGSPAQSTRLPSGMTLVWTLIGVLLGGIALNLTPCVYHLIPLTVTYFGGRSGKSHGALVAHGICYILGLAVTNSTLGLVAALTGGLMGEILQNSWMLVGVAAVLIVFASSLFGFWDLKLPSGLTQAASKNYTGYFGSLFMGLTLGIIAAPCIGPFVLGLLTWIASIGVPWFGFAVFFTLSVGLGLPLFILAMFSGKLEKLPRSGEWMVWVRKVMGWVLVAMAAYFIQPVLPVGGIKILYGFIAFAAGIHLGWIDKSVASGRVFQILKKSVGLTGIFLSIIISVSFFNKPSGVTWQPYSEIFFELARKEERPIIMDFDAAWCAPCRELDKITFHDSKVVQRSKKFVMIKIDLTTGDNEEYQQVVRQFDVKGVPTVVFIDSRGQERLDLRLMGFVGPEDFVVQMDKMIRK